MSDADADDLPPPPAREAAVSAVALAVAALVASGWLLGFRLDNAHNGLLAASFTAVGLYVVRMRPRHAEGRLFVAVGAVHAVMFFGRQYGGEDPALPAAAWIGWVGVWPLPLAIALVGWTVMAFPDGRLLSRRWRAAVVAMFVVAAALAVVSALWPVDYGRTGLASEHPLDVPGADRVQPWWQRAQLCYPLFQALWTAAVVVRTRRARGDEVRQMRWLGYAVLVDLVLLAAGLAAFESPVPGLLALPLIPVAAGMAILKYRLYDIDPVINKTIVIGAMTAAIAVGYTAVVAGAGAVIPAGRGVLWLVTTAAVAVAAEPLRHRAQRLADRIVYGHRATPYEALSHLSTRIDEPPEELLEAIATTVANAIGAREVVVWAGPADRLLPAAARPRVTEPTPLALEELARPGWHVHPVTRHGVVYGAITLRKPVSEPLSAGEKRLLSDLAAQTAMVIAQQRQGEEIQAAARRLVNAEDAARRRIERDLHDGAQQRLVTLGLELGALSARASAADPALAAHVRLVRAQLLDATAELRELARGLHPAVLTEQGLSPALHALADRSPIPVKLTVPIERRLPPDVEAATYFVVSEALTNAARHSGARVVRVCVAETDAGLHLEVADDGRGGATPHDGSGLQGIADRLAALGARFHIDSPPGHGTRITAVLPCG